MKYTRRLSVFIITYLTSNHGCPLLKNIFDLNRHQVWKMLIPKTYIRGKQKKLERNN